MPNNRLWKKGLVIGIIILFVGTGIYPAIAVNLNTSTNINDGVENKDISIYDISNFNFNKPSLLMFFYLDPKIFNSMLKSYSKISNGHDKLSGKYCLEKVNKLVKEKLSMTLKTLENIESKGLIDSSKIKIEIEDLYLKISEISNKYDESSLTFETKEDLPICDRLFSALDALIKKIRIIQDIKDTTESELVYMICLITLESLLSISLSLVGLITLLGCDWPYYPPVAN